MGRTTHTDERTQKAGQAAQIVGRFQAEQKLTDAQMGETLGLSRQTVWSWRTGKAEPSIEQIQKIVKEHKAGTWPFELASAVLDAQYAGTLRAIRERTR